MPLMKVRRKGKTCWKFGKRGKLYCGRGAKEKAKKQMRAIKWRQALRKK